MPNHAPIQPGSTLGVFGGGQLGRMFATAAARMGYRVAVFAPEADPPAAQVAHQHLRADYHDTERVEQFARQCAAITLEFENVPVSAVELAGERTIIRPAADTLAIAQDRLRERAFLTHHGLPVAPYRPVHDQESADQAARALGAPAVLKASRFGYDGRSQALIHTPEEAPDAWASLGTEAAICESFVQFDTEISVLVARSHRGELATFGPIENQHRSHILECSVAPASVDPHVADRAVAVARETAESLQLEGLICVEMFVVPHNDILINELAPRPHNSGHLTIEACTTSQFEQQVRALCGLPLGSFALKQPAAMINLLGDLWEHGEPAWERALEEPSASLHLYGKATPRPGRKMGHITTLDNTAEGARRKAYMARQRLSEPRSGQRNPSTDSHGSHEAQTGCPNEPSASGG